MIIGATWKGEVRRGDTVCIKPRVHGVGGERYENIAPAGVRMTPAIRIADVEDIVVASGQMDYG
jgi:hypothetical protein